MTKTADDIRNQAGRILKLSSEGNSLPSYFATRLTEWVTDVHAMLEEDGLAYWAVGTVPDAVAKPLATYVAARSAHEFLSGNDRLEIEALAPAARAMLERHAVKRWNGAPNRVERF